MCELKDFLAREEIRIHVPKNMVQGCAKVFIRNLNVNSTAIDVVDMIKDERVKVVDLYIIRNKAVGNFTGLAKATLVGNTTINKWLTESRANLGELR